MNKVDPVAIRADFTSEIDRLADFARRVRTALASTAHAKSDETQLSEGVFLSASVLLETLVSDLFLAYVNRDASVFLNAKKQGAQQSIEAKYGKWFASQTRFPSSKHVKIADVRALVDAKGYNISFVDAATLNLRGKEWLAPAFAKRFALTPTDSLFFDSVRAIRDYIAHRSAGSLAAMNDALANIESKAGNKGLGRGKKKVISVGTFLKAKDRGVSRLERFLNRMRALGQGL